jgi:hypothetical protein
MSTFKSRAPIEEEKDMSRNKIKIVQSKSGEIKTV